MKRDMDLVRQILFELQKVGQTDTLVPFELEGYSEEEILYHLRILGDSELVAVWAQTHSGDHPITPIYFYRLSWQGHDFVEAIRNDTNWKKVKQVMEGAGGFVAKVAVQVATSFIEDQVNIARGLPAQNYVRPA